MLLMMRVSVVATLGGVTGVSTDSSVCVHVRSTPVPFSVVLFWTDFLFRVAPRFKYLSAFTG